MSDRARDTIDVAYIARLARLELTDEELRMLQGQLQDIVGYIRKVRELDVSSVEPMSHVIPMSNVFREDETRYGLPRETILANAPVERDGQFIVPRIVE